MKTFLNILKFIFISLLLGILVFVIVLLIRIPKTEDIIKSYKSVDRYTVTSNTELTDGTEESKE